MPLNLGHFHPRRCTVTKFIAFSFTVSVLGLFFLSVRVSELGNVRVLSDMSHASESSHLQYSTIKGIFLQSENSTDAKKFDFRKQNFGLINRDYEYDGDDGDLLEGHRETEGEPVRDRAQWLKLNKYIRYLNEHADAKTQFKVLYLGRHGQGYHNVAEAKYGTAAWDCYWSLLDGADGLIWSDARLTEIGKAQAQEVHVLWKSLEPSREGFPAPEAYYVSPHARAIETADITFQGLELGDHRAYRPVVKELLRETIGIHTCDRRQPSSMIQSLFPHVTLEPNFSEQDPFWSAELREPDSARKARLTEFLDDVFMHDQGMFLSFTAHSGAIRSLLEAIGHRQFDLETGGVIPVVVRAERVDGEREKAPDEPWETVPACSMDPTATAVPN